MSDGWKIEEVGLFRGVEYKIIFYDGGWRCGYVRVRPEEVEIAEVTIACHGGVTWAKTRPDNDPRLPGSWIGFDCHHAGDALDEKSRERYFGTAVRRCSACDDKRMWTLADCREECQFIIEQILLGLRGQNVEEG